MAMEWTPLGMVPRRLQALSAQVARLLLGERTLGPQPPWLAMVSWPLALPTITPMGGPAIIPGLLHKIWNRRPR